MAERDAVRRPARRATVFDVESVSGVSRGTISRYLNGSGYVSKSSAQAIADAIASVGYVPNNAARTLASKSTKTVAFIVNESHTLFYEDPNVAGMLTAANRVLSEADFQQVILIVDSQQSLRRITTHLRGGYVDGAILVSAKAKDALVDVVNELRIPAAMAGRAANDIAIPWVDVNNHEAAKTITERLMATNRQKLAMIQGPVDMLAARERLSGFREALGKRFAPELVVPTPDWSTASGSTAMEAILRRDAAVDGVFCASDALAIGALEVLRQAGKKVPVDVGVVGFDDSILAHNAVPQLSTVRQPVDELGAEMATLVLRQIAGENLSGSGKLLPTTVIWRDSA